MFLFIKRLFKFAKNFIIFSLFDCFLKLFYFYFEVYKMTMVDLVENVSILFSKIANCLPLEGGNSPLPSSKPGSIYTQQTRF